MSAWLDVDLTTVPTDNAVLPEGQYFNFELLAGAKESKFKADRIECAAKVVGGEFDGQVKYFSYPPPAEQPWVRGVFVRLTHALGVEIESGEEPVAYLNRVAGGQFSASVKHRVVDQDGMDTTKDEIKIGNIRAVRQ